jgi:hypothetical protein
MCLPKLTQLLCPFACWLHSLGRLAVFQSISLVHTPLDPGPRITYLIAVTEKHFIFLLRVATISRRNAHCTLGTMIMTFFEKWMQNGILRHIYKKSVSFFKPFHPRSALKLVKKTANISQTNFLHTFIKVRNHFSFSFSVFYNTFLLHEFF